MLQVKTATFDVLVHFKAKNDAAVEKCIHEHACLSLNLWEFRSGDNDTLHLNLVSYNFLKLVFLVYLSPWYMYCETCWLIYKENKCIPNSPIGLALDYFSQHLYWADAELSVIGSVCLDGSDPQVVINGKQGELNNLKLMFVS